MTTQLNLLPDVPPLGPRLIAIKSYQVTDGTVASPGVITLALDRLAAQLDVEPCRERGKAFGAGSSPRPDAN